MANTPNNFFPFFSPPPPSHPFRPPPPHHSPPPPPHHSPPPPPHHSPPPPPPHHSPPPPPPHHSPPPPPHVRPSPPPPSVPPPAPSPDNGPTVIVIVFISCGCVFFLAFLAVALFCFLKKKKKKCVEETDYIHADEHMKIKEQIVKGPQGTEAVVLSIEDDIHVDEVIKKNEKEKFGKGNLVANNPSSIGLISGLASSTGSDDHHHHHHHHN